MKKSLFFALMVFFFCSGKLFAAQLPSATGQDVVNYLAEADYQSWQLWPGKAEFYKGLHPHGSLLTTYVSKEAYQAIEGKTGSIPSGGFVVKENYDADKKLDAVTVMYKLSGYNPDGGDWFWLKYAPDGTIQKEGKVGGCIGCHAAVRNNDWLFLGPVK